MRLHVILPQIAPTEITPPSTCPYQDCQGAQFRLHQKVTKPLKDTVYEEVTAFRYQCLTCGRTFRVYPQGVGRAHVSLRVKGLAVLLYLLGLSYGAVSLALEAFGVYMCKSRVYAAVQEAAERVQGLDRGTIFEGIRTPAQGADVARVRCRGRWLALGLMVDDQRGPMLTAEDLSREDAETLKTWIEPLAPTVGAEIRLTDDADGFTPAGDQLRLGHRSARPYGAEHGRVY
jgi:hypothetical protein